MLDDYQINVSDLHKSYQDGEGKPLHILKGVNFKVKKGSTVSIVGASGTGKSTFLHLLGGLDQADKGEAIIEGMKLSSMNRNANAQFRNRKIGFVFQFHHLLNDLSALENVMMPLRINRIPFNKAKKNATNLLNEVGLIERLDHKTQQLSGGEQQRVAIARAIANSPSIFLADEPTGNLDKKTGEKVLDLILSLNKKHNITLVIITHNPEIAAAMNYQYKMENGLLHKCFNN